MIFEWFAVAVISVTHWSSSKCWKKLQLCLKMSFNALMRPQIQFVLRSTSSIFVVQTSPPLTDSTGITTSDQYMSLIWHVRLTSHCQRPCEDTWSITAPFMIFVFLPCHSSCLSLSYHLSIKARTPPPSKNKKNNKTNKRSQVVKLCSKNETYRHLGHPRNQ